MRTRAERTNVSPNPQVLDDIDIDSCPACGSTDLGSWAFDGESDADAVECLDCGWDAVRASSSTA